MPDLTAASRGLSPLPHPKGSSNPGNCLAVPLTFPGRVSKVALPGLASFRG